MKGIILAGGSGTRLYPNTIAISKQLLPVYDKPMIYYPLSLLMQADIKDILIISTPQDLPNFIKLFGDGSHLGINISYKEQPSPDGLAQAFLLGEEFICGDACTLVLGDNIFYSDTISQKINKAVLDAEEKCISTVFGFKTDEPFRFGVVGFDENNNVNTIIEKPEKGKEPSNYAVVGLYVYDKNVVNYAKQLKPSVRNELEITDLNNLYLNDKKLKVEFLQDNDKWFDTGTMESLLEAGTFIRNEQNNKDFMISNLEEIAFKKGWIKKDDLEIICAKYKNSPYGLYLRRYLNENSNNRG